MLANNRWFSPIHFPYGISAGESRLERISLGFHITCIEAHSCGLPVLHCPALWKDFPSLLPWNEETSFECTDNLLFSVSLFRVPFSVYVVSKIATAFFFHHFVSQPGSSVLSRPLREHKECIIFIFNILPLFATERDTTTPHGVCAMRDNISCSRIQQELVSPCPS